MIRRALTAVIVLSGFLIGGAFGYSQAVSRVNAMQRNSEPLVLSGQDIGFRMTGRHGEKAVGTLVVKIDDQWREVEFATTTRPASDQSDQ